MIFMIVNIFTKKAFANISKQVCHYIEFQKFVIIMNCIIFSHDWYLFNPVYQIKI